MNAYKVEAVVAENGTVILRGLPLQAGDTVEVIVLEQRSSPDIVANTIAVETTALPDAHYCQAEDTVEAIVLEQRPGPYQSLSDRDSVAADQDYLRGIEAQMSEWASAEDESAYHDL